jgi:pheromone shutdown-related protein TraB
MTESVSQLPESVKHITVEGRDIYLVGTAHVSKESVEDVRMTIEALKPDTVAVELCESRFKALTQRDNWENLNIFKVIKEKKAVFLLAQLIMTSFYRRLGEKLDIQPGAEMLEGIKLAQKNNANLTLADRNIDITLKRVWGYLGFWSKLNLLARLLAGLFEKEEIDAELIEKIKNSDLLEEMMAEFTEKFPEIKKRLIDERDIYLAQKLRDAPGQKIVAVIGAGHVGGITEKIQQEHDLEPLTEIPPKSNTGKVIKWAIPILILLLLVVGFFKGGVEHSIESVYIWILVNGFLSAAGAAIALAHPLTVVSAFLAAPLTSLNPFLAAGWVAGLVQALIRRPTVADFEKLPDEISTVKGFWSNPVTKVLLVVVLANLGSTLGTIISGSWIAARSL